MPSLARISNTFFVSLIERLGIRPPFQEGFEISNVVQPVSIVDSDISLDAVTSTLLIDSQKSAGISVGTLANSVLADSGAQKAGNYQVFLVLSNNDGTLANSGFAIERRNDANSANIWSQKLFQTGNLPFTLSFRMALTANERIRLVKDATNATAGATVQASIWLEETTG